MSRRRLLRLSLGLLLGALAAEAGLRLAGHVYMSRLYALQTPLPGDVTIVCLGESSTGGLWVERPESYPGQLEKALQKSYASDRIKVVIPFHVGQNTSQVANRMAEHAALYRPRLVILMVGYNNEWSLAESHIGAFLGADAGSLQVRLLTALDRSRLFKVARYGYLRLVARDRSDYMQQNRYYVWGHPELVRYPPADWIYSFARTHRSAFVELWRHDVRTTIRTARQGGARVLLMTYHINPTYLPSSEFVSMAEQEGVPLVRNDLSFDGLARDGTLPLHVFPQDAWHPNRLGYSVIAANAREAIERGDLLGLGAVPR